MNNDVKLSIYVACLASYNNGILYGRWINISKGKDYILDEISDMLKKAPSLMLKNMKFMTYQALALMPLPALTLSLN